MNFFSYIIKRLAYGSLMFFGVSFLCFFFITYGAPDPVYSLLGLHPTVSDLDELRQQIGLSASFFEKYLIFLDSMISLNFGNSLIYHRDVKTLMLQAMPKSLLISLPGYLLGCAASLWLSYILCAFASEGQKKLAQSICYALSAISPIIFISFVQFLFCSTKGLNLLPVQGWDVNSISNYFFYATAPIIAMGSSVFFYNLPFFLNLLQTEYKKPYVLSAKAFGIKNHRLFFKYILKNCSIPIITKILYSAPLILIGGNLILEEVFNIPGMGSVLLHSILGNDLPLLKGCIGVMILFYIGIVLLVDLLIPLVDKRLRVTLK